MANAITLIKEYMPELDKVYKYTSKTAMLDTPSAAIRPGIQANEVLVAKMSTDGLGNYSRSTGYAGGDATLTWETLQLTQDRGRKFNIDAMDNLETANVSFGMLAGEFIRTKTVPEFDAYRMASYYANAASANKVEANLTTGAGVVSAVDAASLAMTDAEVPEEGRIMFLSTACYNLLKGASNIDRKIGEGNDMTFDRRFMTFDGMRVEVMPKTRFYTAITQYNGTTEGQEAGGYIKAAGGKALNFLIVHPSAVLQTVKHTVNKVIAPDANQTSDGWLYFFRAYHDALVYENKTYGIYGHNATA